MADNPFEEDEGNPFEEDDDVQQVPESAAPPAQPARDSKPLPTPGAMQAQAQAYGQQAQQQAQAYGQQAQQQAQAYGQQAQQAGEEFLVDPALQSRVDQLKNFEQSLNQKEIDLDQREKILLERERLQGRARLPNWPFCKPLIHHNIKEDIPEERQFTILWNYRIWLFLYCLLGYNAIVGLTFMIEDDAKSPTVGDFIIGLVYLLFLPLLKFSVYYTLYDGARKHKAATYFFFLVFFTIDILSNIFFAIGVQGTGALGIVASIQVFNDYIVSGIMALINGVVWAIVAMVQIYIWFRVRYWFSDAGGTEKAKQQAAQQAAVTAAKN